MAAVASAVTAVNAAASQPFSSTLTRAACCTCVTATLSSNFSLSTRGEKSALLKSNTSVTPIALSASVSSRLESTSNFGTLQWISALGSAASMS